MLLLLLLMKKIAYFTFLCNNTKDNYKMFLLLLCKKFPFYICMLKYKNDLLNVIIIM